MALYILDFEDTHFPYQAVIKSTSGGYIGQIPLSASLVGFSAGQAGSSAQVTILPMGGLGSTTIQFNQYDWENCIPTPLTFGDNAEIMAYLSTYFSGQAISPTPTTPQSMYIWTTPLLAIEVRDTIPLFIPFSGGSGIPAEDDTDNYVAGFPATLNEVCVTTTTATLDDTVLVELLQNKAIIADTTIAVGGVASAKLFSIYADLVQDKPLYYKITSRATAGEISLSFRAKVTLPS